jgi:hypothetical protein
MGGSGTGGGSNGLAEEHHRAQVYSRTKLAAQSSVQSVRTASSVQLWDKMQAAQCGSSHACCISSVRANVESAMARKGGVRSTSDKTTPSALQPIAAAALCLMCR